MRRLLGQLHSRYNRAAVEQAALAVALKPLSTVDDPEGVARAARLAERMNAIADETERGWIGRSEMGGVILTRGRRGVKQAITLDAGLMASAEGRRLDEHARPLREYVKVDYFLPGCPPPSKAILNAITDLLEGRKPAANPNVKFG